MDDIPLKRPPVILGSASPRRKKIMAALGIPFSVSIVETEEIHDATDPIHTVTFNAQTKYRACRDKHPESILITADTLVWFDGRLIGKPSTFNEAADFLRAFSGHTQIVYTGVVLGWPSREPEVRVAASSVRFKRLSETCIAHYLEKTQPFDRAGAYDIDENGELLIESICGSYTNVMGLPQALVRDWLCAHDVK